MKNSFRTAALLGLLTALALLAGGALAGQAGMILAFGFMMVINFGSYWFSDKIVLRVYRAREIEEGQLPELHDIVRNLTEKAGLPMPKLYIVPGEAPNAFATGRNPANAAVAVTAGLLKLLDRQEIEGVLAHELAHVANRDTLISAIAASIAGGVALIARMAGWAMIFGGGRDDDGDSVISSLAMIILTPIIAMIIQLAISRSREFSADELGAKFAGAPEGLASALNKLEAYSSRMPRLTNSTATSHMFIVNPLRGAGLAKLFSTHPPTEERIARLMSLSPSY